MSEDVNLADKTILVTGALTDFGAVAVAAVVKAGSRVVLMDRNPKALKARHSEITEAHGADRCEYLVVDLQQAALEDFDRIRAFCADFSRNLDAIIYAHMLSGTPSPLVNYDPPTWAKVMHVNLNATWLLQRALQPLLNASENPAVVAVSGEHLADDIPYQGAYAVAHSGLVTLLDLIHQESTHPVVRTYVLTPPASTTSFRRKALPAADPSTLADPNAMAPQILQSIRG